MSEITIPPEIIQRFASKKTSSLDEAHSIFRKLELFLSASGSARVVPTLEVDEAWHEFILHTKQYADYCIKKFGRFIHHVPSSPIFSDGLDGSVDYSKCTDCSANCTKEET